MQAGRASPLPAYACTPDPVYDTENASDETSTPEQEDDVAQAAPSSSPCCPIPANVAITVPVSPISVAAPVPTLLVSAMEHTIQPGIDPLAFKDDFELKAHIRKFIVQFLDLSSGLD